MGSGNRYDLMIRSKKPGIDAQWHKIGYATALEGDKLICTMLSIPLDWNGEFLVLPCRKIPETE